MPAQGRLGPLPLDPAVPRLATALDPAAMHLIFSDLLHDKGQSLRRCEIDRVKYRPGRNCSIVYRLHLHDHLHVHLHDHGHDQGRGGDHVQWVATRLCNGQGEQRQRKAGLRKQHATRGGPSLAFIPALDMLSWWWPNDAKLDATAVLADEASMQQRWLPPLVAAMSGGRGRLLKAKLQVVQYVPELRVTARVELEWQDEDGRCVQAEAYAKSSREPDTATAHALLAALQASDAWRQGRLKTPAALLHQPQIQLHWQSAMQGQAWSTLDSARRLQLAPVLAAQIATLHATPIQLSRTMDAKALLDPLNDAVTMFTALLPECGEDLQRASRALQAAWPRFEQLPQMTLHGDLHAGNVLVDGDTVSLIDLDGLRRGAAELELGAWAAEVIANDLLKAADAAASAAQTDALFAAYAQARHQVLDPAMLAWATAWSLIAQRARRCVVNLKPGRAAMVPRLIQMAAQWAEQAFKRSPA